MSLLEYLLIPRPMAGFRTSSGRRPVELVADLARVAPQHWGGVPFSAQSGVSVVPLGFAVYNPVTIASWDRTITDARLSAIRDAGFDHVRIAFDPTPALDAPDATALSAVIAVARHAVDATLRNGLKAILDLHVATAGAWSTGAIEADYPAGRRWLRYLEVARAFGMLCAGYPTERLALEAYNENANQEGYGNSAWAQRSRSLWEAVRSVNLNTTLLVGGSFYSSIEGLRDLRAEWYDANTGFVIHNYNPTIFTHQDAASYTRFVERLHYPPIASDHGVAIAGMAARVAASGLPEPERQRICRDRTMRLDAYFAVPQGPNYLDAKIQEAAHWARRNRVPGSRMFVTEFGAHNDHDFRGATPIARMAWIQDVDSRHQAHGFCRTVWNYDSPDYWDITEEDGSWRIKDGFLVALGRQARASHETEALDLFARTSQPTAPAAAGFVSETMRQLKESGLWQKLDVLHVLLAGNATVGMTDWKAGSKIVHDPAVDFTRYLGVANRAGATGIIQFAEPEGRRAPNAPDYGEHVGIYVIGDPARRRLSVGSEARSDALRLDGDFVSVATTDTAGGPATATVPAGPETHLALARTPAGDGMLYVNGSAASAGRAAPIWAGGHHAGVLSFRRGNQAGCAVLHAGAYLSPDDTKLLYTIIRFHLNAVRRGLGS